MAKKTSIDNKSLLILFAIFIVAILCILAIYNLLFNKNDDVVIGKANTPPGVSLNDNSILETQKNIELDKLKNMTERARIEYYSTKFLNYIESGKYSEAYALLNSTFRRNYFSSSEKDFETYCKEKFPKMMDVKYSNIERNGDVYVLWLTITDAINGAKGEGQEINIVVKENTYNDFELSFSKF